MTKAQKGHGEERPANVGQYMAEQQPALRQTDSQCCLDKRPRHHRQGQDARQAGIGGPAGDGERQQQRAKARLEQRRDHQRQDDPWKDDQHIDQPHDKLVKQAAIAPGNQPDTDANGAGQKHR